MKQYTNVIDCYNNTAKQYADKFINELTHKHLDRILLTSFAKENPGRMIDLGCGPGQTTKFLSDCGIQDIIGIDLSGGMIAIAKEINPQLNFEVGDILKLNYPNGSFDAAIAFYSIVHFTYEEIKLAFKEINRLLKKGGEFLFSFHLGDETIHLDELLEQKVNIDFYFLELNKIRELLVQTGFDEIDIIKRQPYNDVEYPSKRAYLWVRKNV